MASEEGQTALVLPVPDAEPAVGSCRERFDPSAAYGMPAHVTVLAPFLSLERIGSDELRALRRLFAAVAAVPVRFSAFGSFPKVLFLQPEPAAPLLGVTTSVVKRWPEAPPYAGSFAEPVPHLTVAMDVAGAVAAGIRAEVGNALPIETVLREAWLFAFTEGRWSAVETFVLGSTRTAAESRTTMAPSLSAGHCGRGAPSRS